MTDYSLPAPESASEIGRRARRVRELLGMTAEQVAADAAVSEAHVLALEEGGEVPLAAALAIHGMLTSDNAGAELFVRPKFRTIDEVVAFERRRLDREEFSPSMRRKGSVFTEEIYDPRERELKKQRAREGDNRDLAEDRITREELQRRNAFIPAEIARTANIIDWGYGEPESTERNPKQSDKQPGSSTITNCPTCHADLDEGSIWEAMLLEYGNEQIADEYTARFGATRTTGRFSRAIAETGRSGLPTRYLCPDCGEQLPLGR